MQTSPRSEFASGAALAPPAIRSAWRDGEGVPALAPRERGVEHVLETHLPRARPIVAFLASALLGLVVLDAIAVGWGLLLVHTLLPFHGLGGQDERVNAWFAAHRSSTLDTASFVGSSIGDVPVLP